MTTKTAKPKGDDITEAYFGDIVKTEKTADGLLVYGKATGPDLDLDQQICDPAWLKKAMPDWMVWGNVREQHSAIAAGVGKELTEKGDDWWLKTLVVDPGTIAKVETGVLKGYSIKIGRPRVVNDSIAKGGRIVGGFIPEVSLVDRPCNPDARMAIAKAEGAALAPVDAAGVVLVKFDDAEPVEKPAEQESVESETAPLSDDDQMAADALAKSVGAPTPAAPVVEDGAPAVKAAKPKKTRVIESAKLVSVSLDGAPVLSSVAYRKAVATVAGVLSGDIVKRAADESADIAGAQAIIGQLADLIISEATELKAGRMEEADDIACLMDAVRAVKYFICCEQAQDGKDVPDAATADTGTALSYVQMSAGANKSANVTPGDAATVAVPDVTELVKAAVTEASTAYEKRVNALEAELAKVLAQPIPGGPMILPPAGTGTPAQTQAQTLAKRYQLQAERADDPNVQRAYRALAAEVTATT